MDSGDVIPIFRKLSRTERPAGDAASVRSVERLTARDLSRGKPGRPAKRGKQISMISPELHDLVATSKATSIFCWAMSIPMTDADMRILPFHDERRLGKSPVRINLASTNSFPFGTVSDTVRVAEQSSGKRI